MRENVFYSSNSTTKISYEDEVYFIVDTEKVNEIITIFGHEVYTDHKVRIVGGGRIGYHLACILRGGDHIGSIKIVERNIARSNEIAELLPPSTSN